MIAATKNEKKSPPPSHFDEPIDQKKELRGYSRNGGDAPPEVQQKIVDIIIEEARALEFKNRDLAYYMAIAKRESEFNPDASNRKGTASGIAQVTDETGKTFGINNSNRFDARSSIKAGLSYFKRLKDATIADYGSAAGDFEPLIYYRYHYGEYSTRHGKMEEYPNSKKHEARMVYYARPLSELQINPHYADSKTVVDDAARIEKILNDAHGLQVKLTDITGKPMVKRKVLVVTKTEKVPSVPQNTSIPTVIALPATSPVPATVASPDPTLPPTDTTAPVEGNDTSVAQATDNAPPPSDPATGDAAKPIPDSENSTKDSPATSCGSPPTLHVEWVLNVSVFETDDDGNLPQIESTHSAPVMILIPRPDYEAYNDAIEKNLICESGNAHHILPHDDERVLAPIADTSIKKKLIPAPPVSTPAPVQPKKSGPPKGQAPAPNIFDTASKQKDQPSTPSAGKDITFSDVAMAIRTVLGWEGVYESAFSYIKQFHTRPKLPDKPLDNTAKTTKGEARLQVVRSSLLNKDVAVTKTKDQVTTATETAVKTVAVSGDAPWMNIALAEQTKGVRRIVSSQVNDQSWVSEKNKRDAAIESIKKLNRQLAAEAHKKNGDPKRISELKSEISEQENTRDAADKAMLAIEPQYNNQDVLKYLNSTSAAGTDTGRNDNSSWCSSFVNWCVEQAGFHGTHNAMADSWTNWGEKIDVPRYGAITVVKRGEAMTKKGMEAQYHVGFFTGTIVKNHPDGFDEVEVNGKKVKKKKYKKVNCVALLSGNMSDTIRELAEWTVNEADDANMHLVGYHWPTAKEKK